MFNRNLYIASFIIVSLILLIFTFMYNNNYNNNKIVLTSSVIDIEKYAHDPYPTRLKDHEVIEIKG